jgi:hypothetical protein
MREDGSCPRCGRNLDTPKPTVTADNLDLKKLAAGDEEDSEDYKAPWHFKLLVVLLVVYLTWRFIQLLT